MGWCKAMGLFLFYRGFDARAAICDSPRPLFRTGKDQSAEGDHRRPMEKMVFIPKHDARRI